MNKNLRSLLLRDAVHAVATFVVAFIAAAGLSPTSLTWDGIIAVAPAAAVVALRKLEPELIADAKPFMPSVPVVVSSPAPPAGS